MNTDDAERWNRLAELFDAALELPPDVRDRFLTERCSGDASMRADLARMLAADAHADAGAFLETPVSPLPDDARERWTDDYAPGSRRFGAYRLLRLIGRGGMGEVHLAERADGEFEQRVALKLLPHPTPGLMQRFRRERQILARLEHPNIARLLDGGVGEWNIPYFAMEFVDGQPITQFAATKRLDVRATLQLFLGVCEAVGYAHRNLVLHRDIKPSNILVGEDGVAKLLDFGIAKLLETTSGEHLAGTQTHAFTPDYAAPEQIRGEAVSTATDVYGLGVVLYELLGGARPYRLDRGMPVQQAILGVDPPAPSVARERQADARGARTLRGDLDRIALTALAKEPERRYASVDAFAEDLRRHLDGRPVRARGDSAWYRARKFVRRNRIAIAAAAVAAVALIAATAVSVRAAAIARDEARRAEQQRDLYRNEAAHVQSALHYLALVFGEMEKAGDHSVPLHEALAQGAEQIEKRLAGNPSEQASIARFVGELFSELNDDKTAAPLLRRFLASPDAVRNPIESADTRMYLAQAELRLGDANAAKNALDSAQAFWREDEATYGDRLLRSRIVQGQIEKALGDFAGAIRTYREAIPQAWQRLGAVDETTVQLTNSLALVLMQTGELDEAGRLMDEVIASYRSPQLGGDEGSLLIAEQNRGAIAFRQKDYARAESLLRHATEEGRARFGESAALASGVLNLGKTLLAQQRADDAVKAFAVALPMARKFSGEHSQLTIAALQGEAEARLALGDDDAAAPLVAQTVELSRAQFGDKHPLYGVGLMLEARLHHLQGRDTDARADADRAIAIFAAAGDAAASQFADAKAFKATLPPG
ncbi:MAG: protein kinase [Rudaea sp.]|uniref:serine/threonine-protein kinase n=1 Tax=Rudaea sp. TaxID=2136325 RepID=UPI0039E46E76